MAAAAELLYPKLVIFGATGPMGILAVKRALELGHYVTAIVRSPEKLQHIKDEKLEVVKGNIFDADSLAPILEGKAAAMSFLGVHGTSIFNSTTLYSESMNAIMTAMQRAKVERILAITSWCTKKEPGSPRLIEWFLKPLLMNGFIRDMLTMEQALQQSAFNYTIVRPPGLSNAEPTGKYTLIEGQFVEKARMYIPRADVAEACLQMLETHDWDHKAVAIGRTC